MKRKSGILVGAVGVAVVVLLGAIVLWSKFYDHRIGNFSKPSALYVYPGTTPEDVLSYIEDSCYVKKASSLRRAFKDVESVKPGYYRIAPSSSSVYVGRMLSLGWQSPVRLVLSGSMRSVGTIAHKISSQMMLDSLDAVSALKDRELLARFGFTPEDVFSLIIPDTYEVYWTESMEEILIRQKAAWDAFWTPENLDKASKVGLTPKQVSILASIVKGETNYVPEMPKVAGVYLNRLAIGMRLQADPTIAYILNYNVSRILKSHLQIASPYNTYLNTGLPPGPIQVPTKDCLEAVLNPDKNGDLYFCASDAFDGTHNFAKTYTEHLANARRFQSALNRRNSGM